MSVLFKDKSSHLPAQILIIHVPNKQRLGGKCVRLHIHICSCHLKPNKTITGFYPLFSFKQHQSTLACYQDCFGRRNKKEQVKPLWLTAEVRHYCAFTNDGLHFLITGS